MNDVNEVERVAKELIKKWCPGTLFSFSRTKKVRGRAYFEYNRIELSIYHARHASMENVIDIILHEIAHILAYPHVYHGQPWIDQCLIVGAKPVQYYDGAESMPGTYESVCEFCNYKYRFYKKINTEDEYICGNDKCRENNKILEFRKVG